MTLLSRYDGIEPYAVRTAIYFADKLIQGSYFNQADREDIVQELILHYLLKAKKYDKSRGSEGTFIFECMRGKARNLLDEKKALKRSGGMEITFSDLIRDEDDNLEDLFSLISSDSDVTSPFDDYQNKELSYLLARVKKHLSDEEIKVCNLLEKTNPYQICLEMGISRRKFDKILERIKRQFPRLSLDDYLKK